MGYCFCLKKEKDEQWTDVYVCLLVCIFNWVPKTEKIAAITKKNYKLAAK